MTVTFAITVDVDQDGVLVDNRRTDLTWSSVEYIPEISSLFRDRKLPATWFPRADLQLDSVYGSPGYLFERFSQLWKELESNGDELGWHPHLYRQSAAGEWVQETDDQRCSKQLLETYPRLSRLPHRLRTVRLGEAFHGNKCMDAVDRLGLLVDSTAIPGRRRDDTARRFDWSITPNAPYRPSRTDWRVPGRESNQIWEIPMTTIRIKIGDETEPQSRYISLAYRAEVLVPAFKQFIDGCSRDRDHIFVIVLHAEEAGWERIDHPLYRCGLLEIARNMDHLFDLASEIGDVRFSTLGDIGEGLAGAH